MKILSTLFAIFIAAYGIISGIYYLLGLWAMTTSTPRERKLRQADQSAKKFIDQWINSNP